MSRKSAYKQVLSIGTAVVLGVCAVYGIARQGAQAAVAAKR